MSRPRKPWFRKATGWWMVEIGGRQVKLARGRDRKADAERKYHLLMAEIASRVVIASSRDTAMSFPTERADVDLRPWAAYATGHHPFDILGRHLMLDEMSNDPDRRSLPDRGPWDRIPRLERELDSALTIVAKVPGVDPARLNEFRASLDAILRTHSDLNNLVTYPGYESFSDLYGNFVIGGHAEELASALPFIGEGDELRT